MRHYVPSASYSSSPLAKTAVAPQPLSAWFLSGLPCPIKSSTASASPVSASSLSPAAVSDLRWEHAPAACRSCVSSSWLPCLDFTANGCQLPPFLPWHLLWEFFLCVPARHQSQGRTLQTQAPAYPRGPHSLRRSLLPYTTVHQGGTQSHGRILHSKTTVCQCGPQSLGRSLHTKSTLPAQSVWSTKVNPNPCDEVCTPCLFWPPSSFRVRRPSRFWPHRSFRVRPLSRLDL